MEWLSQRRGAKRALRRTVLLATLALVVPGSALAQTPYHADLALASRAQLEAFAAGFPAIPSEHAVFPPIPAGYVGGGPGLVVGPQNGVAAYDTDWNRFCFYILGFLQRYDNITAPLGAQWFGNINGRCRINVGSHEASFRPADFSLNTIATVVELFPVPGVGLGDVNLVVNLP